MNYRVSCIKTGFIKIQTTVIHQIEGNCVFYSPVIMHGTLKLISKESPTDGAKDF